MRKMRKTLASLRAFGRWMSTHTPGQRRIKTVTMKRVQMRKMRKTKRMVTERGTAMEKGARTNRLRRSEKVKKRRTRATTTLVRRAAVTELRNLRWSTEVI